MDKQIKMIKSDVLHGKKSKAKKDINNLFVMDKKQDKKVEKYDMMMKKKK